MNDSRLKKVICPFFRHFEKDGRGIVCEGVVSGTEQAMLFREGRQMQRWMERRCNTFEYGGCPQAMGVTDKIDRIESAGK